LLRFMANRLLLLVPILFGVVTITFFLMYVIPGDPVLSLAGERYDEETLEGMRRELGLDRPLFVQYLNYLGRLARFDLGRSFVTGRPVSESIAERFPRTLLLASSAMLLAVTGGVFAGMLST